MHEPYSPPFRLRIGRELSLIFASLESAIEFSNGFAWVRLSRADATEKIWPHEKEHPYFVRGVRFYSCLFEYYCDRWNIDPTRLCVQIWDASNRKVRFRLHEKREPLCEEP